MILVFTVKSLKQKRFNMESSKDTIEEITVEFTEPIWYVSKEILDNPQLMFTPE